MSRLIVFNSVTLDGYFTDTKGDMSWAHANDPEWSAFVSGNAKGECVMVFGRITYQMMASWWPTPQAMKMMPTVAEGMNKAPKVVFSRTLDQAAWNNTTLVKSDPVAAIRKMKEKQGPDILVFGSGTIVSQLAQEGLVDEFQLVLIPVALSKGRTLFEGLTKTLNLKLISTRTFANGRVLLCYEPTP